MSVKKLTGESFDDFVKEGNTIVDFSADWCGPCIMMKPHFEKVSEEIKDVKFGMVDVDENQELAGRFSVMSIPTLLLFKGIEQVDRINGALTGDDLKKKIEEAF